MAKIEVKVLKVLRDNYVYLIHHRGSASVAVVDPGIAGPVVVKLDELAWRVKKVLCTHHHADQIGGNLDIKRAYHCGVVGPAGEAPHIPGITQQVKEGDKIMIGDAQAEVMELPGHTSGQVGYYFRDAASLFCGDVLYPMGCGRTFEGTAEQMWNSLRRIRSLPPDTKIYCAHEYSGRNIKFARSIDHANPALKTRGDAVRALVQGGEMGVPFKLSDELGTNPFLRVDDPAFQAAVGMAGKSPVEVFAELRRRRDEV